MPRYKVGDKVRVVDDLGSREHYYMDGGSAYNCSVTIMEEYRGKVVTIKCVASCGYSIEETGYIWTDEMFSGLAEEDDQEIEIDEGRFINADTIYYLVEDEYDDYIKCTFYGTDTDESDISEEKFLALFESGGE